MKETNVEYARDIMRVDLECRRLHHLLSREQNGNKHLRERLLARDRKIETLKSISERLRERCKRQKGQLASLGGNNTMGGNRIRDLPV